MSIDEKYTKVLMQVEDPIKTMTADTGKYSYDYETIQDVKDVIEPVLEANGLWYRQCSEMVVDTNSFVLVTMLVDLDDYEQKTVDVRPLIFGSDAQKNGAYETYSRRYALKTVFNLSAKDTDAIETRGATMTSEDVATRIRKGLEALKGLDVDTDRALPGFEGWETDSRIAASYLDAIKETYRQASVVQGQFPGTKIGA